MPIDLDINVGNVIAGSTMEIAKAKKRIYSKNYHLKNQEYRNKKAKLWYLEKKEIHKERHRKYYKKNKEKIRNRNKKRRHTNIEYKLTLNLRRRILSALQGKNKSDSTIKLLGCTPEFLKKYIESKFKPGMSWNKRNLFHIDHIKPCASFDLSKPEEQEKCFHYTNLQPLWAKDNLSKGAKYDD